MAKIVVGLYDHFEDARRAVEALKAEGFRNEDISLVANDKNGEYSKQFDQGGGDVSDGAAAGAGVGAVVGGLGGLLVGLGALAIPGIGPVLAAGPLISALAGAGIGAAAGGLIGALVDAGVPEEHARHYAEGVRRGGTLVTVRVGDERSSDAVNVLNRFNPVDVDRRSEEWSRSPIHEDMPQQSDTEVKPYGSDVTSAGALRETDMDRAHMEHRGQDETVLPVVEEELRVGKREVDTGGVHVETNVTEEPVEETVNLRRETVDVERRPVDRPATDADFDAFREGSMDINTRAEEPVVEKQARVVEEVHVKKDVEEEQHHVQDTVRRQDVDVQHLDQGHNEPGYNTGTASRNLSGMGDADRTSMSGYDEFEPIWRNHYQGAFTTSGYTYDDYAPAYRYGYTLANDERYRGRQWQDVEMDARRDWETQYHDSPWERFKDAVREGWETVTGRNG